MGNSHVVIIILPNPRWRLWPTHKILRPCLSQNCDLDIGSCWLSLYVIRIHALGNDHVNHNEFGLPLEEIGPEHIIKSML